MGFRFRRVFRLPLTLNLALILCSFVISGAPFGQNMPNTCALRRCATGEVVVTYSDKGSPAVGCPTKNLALYVNFSITIAATFGTSETNVTGEDASLLKKMRENAGVSSFEQAAKRCWPLETNKQVKILEYSDRGTVRVAPVRGGASFWTQSSHLDRPDRPPLTSLITRVDQVELQQASWYKGGLGMVMLLNGTVVNKSDHAVKDIEVTCKIFGRSGTYIDRNVNLLYDIVPARGKRRFNDLNMGLLNDQAAQAQCSVTDLYMAY
jgi:hypothetical protein